jgi:hypothetical protein
LVLHLCDFSTSFHGFLKFEQISRIENNLKENRNSKLAGGPNLAREPTAVGPCGLPSIGLARWPGLDLPRGAAWRE